MDNLNHKSRSRVLALVLATSFALIVGRLFYLQVIRHQHYVGLASKEQVKKYEIPAKRGMIYARDREQLVPLTMNQEVYTVFADPKFIQSAQKKGGADPRRIAETLRSVAGGELVTDRLEADLTDSNTQYKVLARGVSLRQAELIKAKKLRGIGFQKVARRVYPEGGLAAQVLGFVNGEGKGQYGIEGYMNESLTGKNGLLKSVTDIANVPLSIGRDNIRQNPVNGTSYALTIDRSIQAKAEEALAEGLKQAGATDGSVMVMDPNNGHVLAVANLPSYNPSEYTKVTNASAFVNGATMVPFEPGSVMKTFTVATGLDKGVINPQSTYYNSDAVRVGDRTITNAAKGHTGTIGIQTALNYSLNTGMVHIAQRLGDNKQITQGARDTIYDYFHGRLGLGQKTGIELAGEQAGTFHAPNTPQGNAVRFSNVVFGQGLDVTMVQMCAGFSAIVNGGTYHQPTIIAGTVNSDNKLVKASPKPARSGAISPQASRQAREMIHQARVQYTKDDKPGYYIGGKTGTSQTLENGQYVSSQTIGTYIGFGGNHNQSKYVIMVQVSGKKMNLEGNKHAMPIFTDISNWLLDYYQVQPRK